jgi:hypothetical protein
MIAPFMDLNSPGTKSMSRVVGATQVFVHAETFLAHNQ